MLIDLELLKTCSWFISLKLSHLFLLRSDSWCVLCYSQLELLGQSVYDFVHPCDQEELRDLLAPRPGQTLFIITAETLLKISPENHTHTALMS